MSLVAVPISLQVGDRTVKDQICWDADANDEEVDSFSRVYCADTSLPASCRKLVGEAILRHVGFSRAAHDPGSQTTRSTRSERLEKLRLSLSNFALRGLGAKGYSPRSLTCSIDCCVGATRFRDLVTWDLSNPDQQPEAFARQTCQELNLTCAFEAQIAWQIRTQVAGFWRLVKYGRAPGSVRQLTCKGTNLR